MKHSKSTFNNKHTSSGVGFTHKLTLLALLLGLCLSPTVPVHAANTPATVPASAYVSGFVGHAQSYSLSCESRSSADILAYWGFNISETQFLNSLPLHDNPDKGFVGDVNGPWGYTPPNPYGVHALPVAKSLRNFGLDASARYGLTFSELKAEIAAQRPVIVWVIGGVWSGSAQIYTARNGDQVVVARYEHTMVAVGYNENYVFLVDAGNGATVTHPIQNFKQSWAVLGNMAVTARGSNASTSPPASNGAGIYETYVVQPGDNLSKLAAEWGTNWQDLAALNGISYPYTIYVGQVIKTGRILATFTPPPTNTQPPPTNTPIPPTDTPVPLPTDTAVPAQPTDTAVPGQPTDTAIPAQPTDTPIPAQPTDTAVPAQPTDTTVPAQPTDTAVPVQPTDTPPPAPTNTQPPAATNTPFFPTATFTQPAPPTNTPQPEPDTYTVQRGDHLMAIARALQLNWQAIAELNGLTYPYTLQPGQVLQLPGSEAGPPPPPLPGQSTQPTAQPQAQPTATSAPSSSTPASGSTYTVQRGDYLVALGRTWGINWQSLAAANNITYPYIIHPGQVLTIP